MRTGLGSAFGTPTVVGISGERYLTVMTMPLSPRLLVFDLEDWRIACAIPKPIDGSTAVQVVMHKDGRHVSQINSGGAIHVYDCNNGQEQLSGAYVDDEVVIMKSGRIFRRQRGCSRLRGNRLSRACPDDRFWRSDVKTLRRPGIAAATLAGTGLPPPPRLNAPPTLGLAKAAGKSRELRLEATSTAGLDYLQLYASGRQFKRIALSGMNATVAIAEEDRAQVGRLTAVVVDTLGTISAPFPIEGSGGTRQRGKLWSLFVGIDKYPLIGNLCGRDGRSSCELQFAGADATRLARAIGQSPLYQGIQSTVLLDQNATQAAVLAETRFHCRGRYH